jgi:hypothetical protein
VKTLVNKKKIFSGKRLMMLYPVLSTGIYRTVILNFVFILFLNAHHVWRVER